MSEWQPIETALKDGTEMRRIFKAWAIEYTGCPLDGFRRFLKGRSDHPCRTLVFETRDEARAWLRDEKASSAWAFSGPWAEHGGRRIYKGARVVPVTITVERG